MKNKKILKIFLALALIFGTLASSTEVHAGSGSINILGVLEVPYSFYINNGKTVEETLPNQNIKSSSSFDNKEKTRQAIISAPSEGGRFDFDATFYMKQSTGAFGRTLWGQLGGKKTDQQINALPTGYEESKTESYIDLIVNIDEKITPAETVSAYFDSHTWRPTFVYDAESKSLLGDVRNSYTQGQSLKNFTFPSNGKTKYIIRVVPVDAKVTNSQMDAPMKLGFNGDGNNNFTISADMANKIAEDRRNMTEEERNREKELLDKTNGLTSEDVAFLKRFNAITHGNIEGRVLGLSPFPAFIQNQTVSVSGKVAPAGIAATYENPKVTFYKNESANDETKVATVFVEHNKAITTDALADQSVPADPTREGYEFAGWASTRDTEVADFNADASVNDDVNYYAIWKKVELVTYEFQSDTAGKQLPAELNTRLDGKNMNKLVGSDVTPDATIDTSNFNDAANDGVWRFKGWEPSSLTVSDTTDNNNENKFIGKWEFIKNYKLKFIFRSSEANLPELPAEVKALEPAEKIVEKGSKINEHLVDPAQMEVVAPAKSDEGDIPGKWKFKGYTNVGDERTVIADTEEVIGNWEFYPIYDVTYKFISDTLGTDLPESVNATLPEAAKAYRDDKVAPPWFYKVIKDADNRGQWDFIGWTLNNEIYNEGSEKVNVNDNIEFVGKWRHTRGYIVSITHESITEGKVFPFEELAKKALVSAIPDRYLEEGGNGTFRTPLFRDIKVDDGTWLYLDRDTEWTVKNIREDKNFKARWQFVGNEPDDNPGTDNPGTDNPGTDNPGTDNPGTDNPGTDNPGTDNPGTDNPGTDNPGTDNPGTDNPGTDNPGTDNPGTDNPGIDNPSDDEKPADSDEPKDDSTTDNKTTDKVEKEKKKKVRNKTGDATELDLLLSAMALAGLMSGALVIRKRKED